MICESCGATYDDELKVCPECGVSTSLFLEKPALQTVKQTVPDFVNKPGNGPASQLTTQQGVSAESETSAVSNAQQENYSAKSAQKSNNKTNLSAYISLYLGIAIILLSITSALTSTELYELYFVLCIFSVVNIVFSFIGLSNSKTIPKSKTIAIVALFIGFVDLISYILILLFVVAPWLLQKTAAFFNPPIIF